MQLYVQFVARHGSGWLENPQEVPAETLFGLYRDSKRQSIPESALNEGFTGV